MNRYERYLSTQPIQHPITFGANTRVCLACAIAQLRIHGVCDHITYCEEGFGPEMLRRGERSFYNMSGRWDALSSSDHPPECGHE